MMDYVLRQKYDVEEYVADAFSSLEAAEQAKRRCLQAWQEADVSHSFDPRVQPPYQLADPLKIYLWRCGVEVWIEHYELDAPLYVPGDDDHSHRQPRHRRLSN